MHGMPLYEDFAKDDTWTMPLMFLLRPAKLVADAWYMHTKDELLGLAEPAARAVELMQA